MDNQAIKGKTDIMGNHPKRIVIMGATSGIGRAAAELFQDKGWTVGVAGRRTALLDEVVARAPRRTFAQRIDVTAPDAAESLAVLAARMGGMDVYLHCAGTGSQNLDLEPSIEQDTLATNADGFTRMVGAAYRFFATNGGGHIAIVSSIAGTRGLGAAPAYSATKRFQNTYLDALEQLAYKRRLHIRFTDIRPGFVRTALLGGKSYPMLMDKDKVARHIVKAVTAGRRRVVIDWRYAALVWLWRMMPACIWKRFNAFC